MLLDVDLGSGDGPSLLRWLHAGQQTRGQVVVVLCEDAAPGVASEAGRLGALAWLVKSQLTPAELSAVVRGLVTLTPVGEGPDGAVR